MNMNQMKEFRSYREAEGWLRGNGFELDSSTGKWISKRLKATAVGPAGKGRKYVVKVFWGQEESTMNRLDVLLEEMDVVGGLVETSDRKIEHPSDFDAAEEGWFEDQYGKYGRLAHRLPVDAWHVGNDGKPKRVTVVKLRGGGADYYDSGSDYADFEGGRHGLTVRVFPMKGFSKPVRYSVKDKYGWVGRWFAFRRGKKPKFIEG